MSELRLKTALSTPSGFSFREVSRLTVTRAQQVFINFEGLTWPHTSVAAVVPASAVPVPGFARA